MPAALVQANGVAQHRDARRMVEDGPWIARGPGCLDEVALPADLDAVGNVARILGTLTEFREDGPYGSEVLIRWLVNHRTIERCARHGATRLLVEVPETNRVHRVNR